jgi:hypothetical protein
MINPTMAMIPSGYGPDKIYSILPNNGDGDLTFVRNSKAYRTDGNGLVSEVSADYPRLDYSDRDCPAIMIERSGVNEIKKSEDIAHANWNKTSGITVTANQTISPDGTLNADLVQSDGIDQYPRIFSTQALTGDVAISAYFKQNVGDQVYFYTTGTFSTTFASGYKFTFGTKQIEHTVGDDVLIDSQVEELDNGWFRVGIVLASTAVTRVELMPAYESSAVQSAFMWGVMAEESNHLSSYIKRSIVSVVATRSAETINSKILPINSSEGVLYVEMAAMYNSGTQRDISLNGGANSIVSIGFGSTNNTIVAKVSVAGVDVLDTEIVVPNIRAFSKVALKYRQDDYALWIDGVEVATSTGGDVFVAGTLTQLSFDVGGLFPIPFYGKVKDIRMYDQALTNENLQLLTS